MIDRLNRLKITRLEEADTLLQKSQLFFHRYDLTGIADGPEKLKRERQIERAKKWAKRAYKLKGFETATNRRIKYFSQKLAELKSGVLPGIMEDGSVGV